MWHIQRRHHEKRIAVSQCDQRWLYRKRRSQRQAEVSKKRGKVIEGREETGNGEARLSSTEAIHSPEPSPMKGSLPSQSKQQE